MTARIIHQSCLLPGPTELVWDLLQRPDTLHHISRGRVRFRLQDGRDWPETWRAGVYRCTMTGPLGVPLGWQVIHISFPPAEGDMLSLRDKGEGQFTRTWDHLITVEPEGPGTRYTDQVKVDAGIFTPAVVWAAKGYFCHRQARLRRLVQDKVAAL